MIAATDQEMSGAKPEGLVLTHGTLGSEDRPMARDFYSNEVLFEDGDLQPIEKSKMVQE